MIAVITGDIINSREIDVKRWLAPLKKTLNYYGNEPKNWEIFRGDSFQLLIEPQKALLAAMHIKATIKQLKSQDVRMAIGIGDESYESNKITESNGSAYIMSGDCFEALKKQTLAIKTTDQNFSESINIMLSLALLTANNWSSTVAKVITTTLEHSDKKQEDLAQLLNKSQSSISEALKRGGFEEIMTMNNFYKAKISQI
ncbi:SatD family protein [Winogradskyella endarachnes]|uniref:Transcriptional regulator n=1 Tax=Winogradskyella endarachnes TaxID=2681965 RepID=A0A6L6U545_9FLAO|nr:SatD family protein [Winogradskyella endarachnes]MUU77220.1 transcriptional regulator [Winogradskyella endarachnes]